MQSPDIHVSVDWQRIGFVLELTTETRWGFSICLELQLVCLCLSVVWFLSVDPGALDPNAGDDF
jgi:hypothetical protein